MKVSFKKLCVTALLSIGLSTPAWSIVISDVSAGALNGSYVGIVDVFLAEDAKKGSTADELAWVNNIIAPQSTSYDGIKTPDVSYFQTDQTNVFAFQLLSEPGYYIVKNATRVALFENVNSYGWGVFDLSQFSSAMNLSSTDELVISHVTEFGEITQVSEPATLALLGLGLIGLSFSRRQNK